MATLYGLLERSGGEILYPFWLLINGTPVKCISATLKKTVKESAFHFVFHPCRKLLKRTSLLSSFFDGKCQRGQLPSFILYKFPDGGMHLESASGCFPDTSGE
jgi:hypothetical protein